MTDHQAKPRIMIIDDSEVDRELLAALLEDNDFEIVREVDAVDCLSKIKKERPDLLLLDIVMAGVDGGTALQTIRKEYSEIQLPIIMVSAKSDDSDVVESLKNGANDYILKPFQAAVAMRRVKTQLNIAFMAKAEAAARDMEIIHAMVTTYNHQINNPLTIALGAVSTFKKVPELERSAQSLERELWRIAEIVKSTREALKKSRVEYETYLSHSKMLKLTKN